MIKMRVRQQQQADIGNLGRDRRPIEAAQIPRTLEQAGIDHDLRIAVVHQIARPCHRFRCAEERDAKAVGRSRGEVDPCFPFEQVHPDMAAGMMLFPFLVHELWPASHAYCP